MKQAEEGIKNLEKYVDALIVIPNENLKRVSVSKITLNNAFAMVDDVLVQTVKNIVDLIQNTSFINCDFADISAVLKKSGYIHTTTGRAVGYNKTALIIEQLKHNQLSNTFIDGAIGILLYITIANNVVLQEVDEISSAISKLADTNVNLIFGLNFDESLCDEIKVLIVATHKL